MPTPNPTLRREFKGAAAATTLQNSISGTDVSFLLVAANNWPTGAVGKFIITINRGQADEEKILCDSQTSRTISCLLANRGFDGTSAQAHAAGATVECTLSAFDADEWNQHTNATTGVHGVAGAVVGTTDTQTLTNKTLTAPTINGGTASSQAVTGATLDGTSTLGGVTGTALGGARGTFAPAPTQGVALSTSTSTAEYSQVGKQVTGSAYLVFSSTGTAATQITATLPVGPRHNPAGFAVGSFYLLRGTTFYTGTVVFLGTGAQARFFTTGASDALGANPAVTVAPGDVLTVQFSYESA